MDYFIKNEKISVSNIQETDIENIIDFIFDNFALSIPKDEMKRQLKRVNVNTNLSMKCTNENNEICGILIMADFHICHGTPISEIDYNFAQQLKDFKCLNGFLFLIKEKFRGYGLDKILIKSTKINIDDYDIIWGAVDKALNSHKYWERYGFVKFIEIENAIFYLFNNANNNIIQYLLYKIGNCNENYYN